jgi:hypothetical protein
MLSPIDTMLNLRHRFTQVLDIERGDGACALSLLDDAIETAKSTIQPTETFSEIPEVYSLGEAIEFFAEQFFAEMSFDEVHDLAVELLEQRIIQLTNQLNATDTTDN